MFRGCRRLQPRHRPHIVQELEVKMSDSKAPRPAAKVARTRLEINEDAKRTLELVYLVVNKFLIALKKNLVFSLIIIIIPFQAKHYDLKQEALYLKFYLRP